MHCLPLILLLVVFSAPAETAYHDQVATITDSDALTMLVDSQRLKVGLFVVELHAADGIVETKRDVWGCPLTDTPSFFRTIVTSNA